MQNWNGWGFEARFADVTAMQFHRDGLYFVDRSQGRVRVVRRVTATTAGLTPGLSKQKVWFGAGGDKRCVFGRFPGAPFKKA